MSSRHNEEGYTMVEAVVAVAVLSLIGGAVVAFAFGGEGAIQRARSAAASATTLARLEKTLADAAGRVRIPYWERGARIALSAEGAWSPTGAADSGRASVPYFDGERTERLEISWGGGLLSLASPGGSVSFAPLSAVGVVSLPDSGSCPRGLRVDFSMRGKSYSVAAHFGGAALPAAGRD